MYNTYCTIFTNIPNFNHSNRYTLSKQNFTIIKIKRIFFSLNYTKYSIHKYHFCFSKQNSNKYTSIILSFNFKERRNTHIEEISPQTSLRENVEINRVFNLTRLAINAHRVSPLLKCPSTFNSTRFNRIQPIYIYIYISTGETSKNPSPSTSIPFTILKKDFHPFSPSCRENKCVILPLLAHFPSETLARISVDYSVVWLRYGWRHHEPRKILLNFKIPLSRVHKTCRRQPRLHYRIYETNKRLTTCMSYCHSE